MLRTGESKNIHYTEFHADMCSMNATKPKNNDFARTCREAQLQGNCGRLMLAREPATRKDEDRFI